MLMIWAADSWQWRGVVSRRWPLWRKAYGEFTLEQPLARISHRGSVPMKGFLAKSSMRTKNELVLERAGAYLTR